MAGSPQGSTEHRQVAQDGCSEATTDTGSIVTQSDVTSTEITIIKPSYPSAEGLQVVERDFEGLQPAPDLGGSADLHLVESPTLCPTNLDQPTDEKQAINWWHPFIPRPGLLHVPTKSRDIDKQRRRRFLAITAGVSIILVSVLGGVFGSRSHAQDEAREKSMDLKYTLQSRMSSPQGAWNGTGIAAVISSASVPTRDTNGLLFFQDYTGALQSLHWAMDNSRLSIQNINALSVTARNCTGIAIQSWLTNWTGPNGNIEGSLAYGDFQLVFQNYSGTWADVWSNGSSGDWLSGNLHQQSISAPSDIRPAVYLSKGPFDGNGSTHGARLFAGAQDGVIHQHSYDKESHTWYPDSAGTFSNSWTYGSVFSMQSNNTVNATSVFRTLFYTDQTGAILSSSQTFSGNAADNTWPSGPAWTNNETSNLIVAPNSGIVVGGLNETGEQYLSLLFANQGGEIGGQTLTAAEASQPPALGTTYASLKNYTMMPGSDIAVVFPPNGAYDTDLNATTLIFYQDEGTSIAWLWLDVMTLTPIGSGHFRVDGAGDWIAD